MDPKSSDKKFAKGVAGSKAAEKVRAGATSNTTSSPLQTTVHALQEDPGRVAAGNQYKQWVQEIDGHIWANKRRLVEDPEYRSTTPKDLMITALTEMVRDGQMTMQQIKQTIRAQQSASSQSPGDPAGPKVASVSSSQAARKQVKFKIVCAGAQDAEVQADLGFTGCHLISGDLITAHIAVQTDEVLLGFTGSHLVNGDLIATQTEVDPDQGKKTKTQARNLRRRKIMKKWKDSTEAGG